MKKLEASLGTSLFVRNGQQCVLTESGEYLFRNARSLVFDLNNVFEQTRVADRFKNTELRIATRSALFTPVFTTLLDLLRKVDLAEDYDIKRIRQTHGHLDALRNGEVEIAIGNEEEIMESSEYEDFRFHHVCSSYLACLMPQGHRLAEKPLLTLEDLASERLILFDYMYGFGNRQVAKKVTRDVYALNAHPENTRFVEDAVTASMLCQAGMGVTILDSKHLVSMTGTCSVPLRDNYFTRNGFFTQKGAGNAKLGVLIDALPTALREPMVIGERGRLIPQSDFLKKHPIYLV